MNRYRAAAAAHSRATLSGDAREANRQYAELNAAFVILRSMDPPGLALLTPLMTDEDAGVRLWSASHLLSIAPDRASKVLEKLDQQEANLIGFDAKQTLKEWRAGRLSFS